MNPDLLTMALIVGGFTWAFRFLPTKVDTSGLPAEGLLARFLAATGPAAITTLFVASALPLLSPRLPDLIPLLAGLAAVVAVYFARRSVVLATLAGALAYGLAFAAMAQVTA